VKTPHKPTTSLRSSAFTRLELAVTVLILGILVALLLPMWRAARGHANLIQCNSNNKEVWLAFIVFANEHGDKMPPSLPSSLGGSAEYAGNSETYRHFLAVSNQLGSPSKLVCPADSRRAAAGWSGLRNDQLSYFLTLNFDERNGGGLAMGDRHLASPSLSNAWLTLTSNSVVSWGSKLHGERVGNLSLADGHVLQSWEPELRKTVLSSLTNAPTNHLVFP